MVAGCRSQRSHLSALRDDYIIHRLTLSSHSGVLNLVHDVHAVDDFAENDMLVVEVRSRNGREEELAAIGIRPRVLEGQKGQQARK